MIYGALVTSVASENGARMQAMDSATRSAKDMLADLSMRMITGLNRIVIYTLLSQDCQLLTLQTITETVHGGYATVLTCV